MICLVGFANLRLMQYLNKYTDILDEHNINYDVVYWNRELEEEKATFKGKNIPYNYAINTNTPFRKKIYAFIKYSIFMLGTIRKNKYDKLIVLTSQAAIPLYSLLLRKYKNKYIYDYRDITKERYGFYKKMVKRLVENSYFTAISSLGFKKVIGESDKFVMAHNCSKLKQGEVYFLKKDKLNISFWGLVRNYNYNCRICDIFGNDKRFELCYHGLGIYKKLENYCLEKGYKNIKFTGKYDREKIKDFADSTDIIHCAYPNDEIMKFALPVKAYDAIRYAKPLIINKGSYLAKFLSPYTLPYEMDIVNERLADDIYNWYNDLDRETFESNLKMLYNDVIKDDEIFETSLLSFCEMKK